MIKHKSLLAGRLSLWILGACLWGHPSIAFGQGGSIQGLVWYDSDSDGVYDTLEPPLPGWPIQLQNGRQTYTRANGSYSFLGLAPGHYTVTQPFRPGWVQSFPKSIPTVSMDVANTFIRSQVIAGTDSGSVMGQVLETGPDGAFYLAGNFKGAVDLDPTEEIDLHSVSGAAAFVTKVNRDGSYGWSWTVPVGYSEGISGITNDANGLYVVGSFALHQADFGPPGQPDVQSHSGGQSLFVTHLKFDGSYAWTRVVGGRELANIYGTAIAADHRGDLYLTGYFNRTVDFDPGPSELLQTATHGNELFLLKMDIQSGDPRWLHTTHGLMVAKGVDLEVDHQGQGVFLLGEYRHWIDFKQTSERVHLQSHGDWDSFVARFSDVGEAQWVHEIKGSYSMHASDLAVDAENNVLVTGMYTGWGEYIPGGDPWRYDNETLGQCYLAKLDEDGTFLWSQTYGSPLVGSAGTGVCTDPAGHVYLVGEMTDTNWDLAIPHESTLFLAAFGRNGETLFSKHIEGLYPTELLDRSLYSFIPNIWRVSANDQGDIAVAGPFDRCVSLDPDDSTPLRCPEGRVDTFITQYGSSQGSDDQGGDPASWSVTVQSGQTVSDVDFANRLRVN